MSSGDSFTKDFIFENTGSLEAKISLNKQDIVKSEDPNKLDSNGEVYKYTEGPYDIIVTSKNGKFSDFGTGINIKSGKTVDFEMKISLNPSLDNKYNDNGNDEEEKVLDQVVFDLLEKQVSVELTELSKK